ncbi:MAG: AI-2E family transporter [Verrucomicrobia bacterium]|nr:AI-2E family transporter [Verrucomicrobiota bacterium]
MNSSHPPPHPTQIRILWWTVTALAVAVLVGLVAGMVWGVGQVLGVLSPVLWPLALAGVLAYLLDPVVDFIERRGIARARAISLVFVSALVIVAGLFASVAPQIYRETRQFAERVPDYSQKFRYQMDSWATNPPVFVRKLLELRSTSTGGGGATNVSSYSAPVPNEATPREPQSRISLQSASAWLVDLMPASGAWFLGQVGKFSGGLGILAGLFLVPVYAFFFLLEKRGIEREWTDYLPLRNSEFKDELVFILRSINDYLIVFFRSQLLVAMCDGLLYTLGFLIIGLPYAFIIGLMATVLTMIPFLGAITTCVAALLVGFASSGDWVLPAKVIAVFAVVQTLEGLVISPKIMGDRVGLHPLTIIIAVMVGTTLLGGLLGGILAIPLTAALRVLMFRYVWRPPSRDTEGAKTRSEAV